MDKIDTNKLDLTSRVLAEKNTDSEWRRYISITGGYHALSQLSEALKEVLDMHKAQVQINGLKDYHNLDTTIQIRLKDWE